MVMRVAIVGCGLIGHKRARSLGGHPLAVAADVHLGRARQLAAAHGGSDATDDWRACVTRPDVDAVVVATVNDSLAPVTLAAVQAGKHVLVEKPAARNAEELEPVVEAARQAGVCVKVGFNHRFHPALSKAKFLADAGEVGPLLYVRARYGHGGRVGYDREWRADPAIAGGGELLDQGVHLIDLSRWFLGEFSRVEGSAHTFFWDMAVEDNGFIHAQTEAGQVAWLHASCTEWKNTFSFEIYGRDGKLQIDGLGGSYGVERLSFYRMLPEMGPPETTIWEFPGEDRSWSDEFAHFAACVESRCPPKGTLEDALAALRVVGQVYERSARARELAGVVPMPARHTRRAV
jgi:predicted dehydrogenase